jgi:hypothetical protein
MPAPQQLWYLRVLAMGFDREHAYRDAEVVQQQPGAARVFAGDEVTGGECGSHAWRQIVEVADRCRADG